MVATRRKREVDGSSSEEEENPKDADFTTHAKKIPLLDARTTAQYKLYQGRLYVNCTTFPSP